MCLTRQYRLLAEEQDDSIGLPGNTLRFGKRRGVATPTRFHGTLELDPASTYLNDHLVTTMQQKLEFLRQAARMAGAAS